MDSLVVMVTGMFATIIHNYITNHTIIILQPYLKVYYTYTMKFILYIQVGNKTSKIYNKIKVIF